MRVLVEMRPALDGHAGIPQETRLLFRGLNQLETLHVEGLLQSSVRVLAKGLPAQADRLSADRRVNRLSRVVISLQPGGDRSPVARLLGAASLAAAPLRVLASSLLGRSQGLGRFDAMPFQDFVWRALFAKSLPFDDFEAVVRAGYRVARMPWSAMHVAGLASRRLGHALYPRLDTSDFDVMIAETPYPGRVDRRTQLVVRYHDAIPVLMPHTISDRSYHQASHFNALRRNVRDGAWFACVSDATRRDLVSLFPQVEPRAVTIPNMVSHHYWPETGGARQVAEVLRTRRNAALEGGASVDLGRQLPSYLLMVSTIEPRKNHLAVLGAWERLRAQGYGDLQLVFVGSLGWDHKAIVRKFRPWLGRGGLHVLEDVPSDELRLLYSHAQATVCPSFGEGFDYSGIEAMRCGGVVAASDIPVHRDVFGTAAQYFSPYSVPQLADALLALMGPQAAARRAELVRDGEHISASYLPQRVLPQWQQFLSTLRVPDPDDR